MHFLFPVLNFDYIVISRINCRINRVVDLSPNFVLLCVKNEVALTERPSHAADVLDALTVLFARFVRLNQLVLEFDKQLHLTGEGVELRVVKLGVI